MTGCKWFLQWKWWTLAGVLAVIPLGGAGFLLTPRTVHPVAAQDKAPDIPSGVHVGVIHPQTDKMERTSSQPGSVQAFESVQLFAGVSGYLKTQTVDIGSLVQGPRFDDKGKQTQPGQVLATVDVPELEKQVERCASVVEQNLARVAQMKARVTSAKAELVAAQAAVPEAEANAKSKAATLRFREKQLKRFKELAANGSIDERLVDEETERRDAAVEAYIAATEAVNSAKARVASTAAKIEAAEADTAEAEAEVKVAQAELDKARVFVQFATISAPFDGIVTQRNFFPNDYVRAAGEGGTSKPLLTVQRTDLMRVVVQVPDRDVPYCKVGNPATVEIDALPGEKFPAKVSRTAQSEDAETRLMRVEIDVPNPTGKITNGMYGRVTIFLEKSNLLSIPSSCLVGRMQDGKGSVYVVRDGHLHLTVVQIGSDNGLTVGIASGLKPDDAVVVHTSGGMADGTPVVVSGVTR